MLVLDPLPTVGSPVAAPAGDGRPLVLGAGHAEGATTARGADFGTLLARCGSTSGGAKVVTDEAPSDDASAGSTDPEAAAIVAALNLPFLAPDGLRPTNLGVDAVADTPDQDPDGLRPGAASTDALGVNALDALDLMTTAETDRIPAGATAAGGLWTATCPVATTTADGPSAPAARPTAPGWPASAGTGPYALAKPVRAPIVATYRPWSAGQLPIPVASGAGSSQLTGADAADPSATARSQSATSATPGVVVPSTALAATQMATIQSQLAQTQPEQTQPAQAQATQPLAAQKATIQTATIQTQPDQTSAATAPACDVATLPAQPSDSMAMAAGVEVTAANAPGNDSSNPTADEANAAADSASGDATTGAADAASEGDDDAGDAHGHGPASQPAAVEPAEATAASGAVPSSAGSPNGSALLKGLATAAAGTHAQSAEPGEGAFGPSIRAQVLAEIAGQSVGAAGHEKMTLQLEPAHLGKVQVQLQASGGRLEIVVQAQSAEAEKALADGAQELIEAIVGRGEGRWQQVEVRIEKNAEREQRSPRDDTQDRGEKRGGNQQDRRRDQRPDR